MDEIKLLGEKTCSNIKSIQDFQVFTGHSYAMYLEMVRLGHLSGSVQNTQTQTNLSKEEMSKILSGYLDNELQQIVFYEVVACFDYFFVDFSKLKRIPGNLKFEEKLKICGVSEDDILRLNEIRQTRHCFAHNSGFIDKKYIEKSGKFSRGGVGDKLVMSRPYAYGSLNFIKNKITEFIDKQ
jgi:hypothetical protein